MLEQRIVNMELPSSPLVNIERGAVPPEWDEYVAGHPDASVYHQAIWRDMIARVFSRETYYLMARRDGHTCGVLPIVRLKSMIFGDFLVSIPYVTYGGILASDAASRQSLLDAATELARTLGVSHVELRHTAALDGLAVRTDKVSMHLSLPDDPDALFSAIGSKLRAQVRRPRKEGAETVLGGAELLDDFYRIFARKYRDLGVPVYPKRWFREILQCQPAAARIVGVRLNQQIVAASLILGYRDRLEVPYAASLREADRYSVNMLLYWGMMEYAIGEGFGTFDFGRTTPGSGTHRFKKQWGAEPVQLYWHYWLAEGGEVPQLNTSNRKYEMVVNAWRRLPVRFANVVGPHIVKNLP
jgi:FemAB-related protein (PEP-CTERM system-associated)